MPLIDPIFTGKSILAISAQSGQVLGTVPSLTGLSAGTIAATTLTNANVRTDTSTGTIYMAVVSNGGSATTLQIIAGSGGNIVSAANVAAILGSLQTIASITGLVTATTYQLIAVQVSSQGTIAAQLQISFVTA